MYSWNIFKTLIYLLFFSKKYGYSEQQDAEINTSLKPISLNINNKLSENNYDYTKTDNSETYTANNGFGFTSVNVSSPFSRKGITIWAAITSNEYSNKVVLTSYEYKNMKDLRVFMINGHEKMYIRKYKEPWTELDLTKNIFVHLIIETMHDTYSYHTSGNDAFRTFEAKSPFLFCKIVSLSSLNVTKKIWNASNPNECANKVIINNPKTCEKTNKLAIISSNGDIKHFALSNFKWVEIHPWTVLNISHRETTYEYQYFKHENNVECFIPNVNFLFKAVRVAESLRVSKMNVEIWRGRDSNRYARMVFYARSPKNVKYVVLILANNEFIAFRRSPKFKMWTDRTNDPDIIKTLQGLGINLEKFQQTKEKIPRTKIKPRKPVQVDYKKWLESLPFLSKQPETKEEPAVPEQAPAPEATTLINLDITKMYGFRGYKVLYKDNKVMFVADKAYLFLRVQRGNELIWSSKDGYHPYLVVYKEVDGVPKIKVYFPDFKPTDPTPNP
ncbi:hypothetical protein MACK_001518 [Theileria orientalis]|uniref:Signal peptide-containing protein n=1 Tax=Theileria orientalis TaxID=68886 RepID=A0A976MCY8_THEOR|nr:hypothetical protein MACK_001518 [Theileria orientalis]